MTKSKYVKIFSEMNYIINQRNFLDLYINNLIEQNKRSEVEILRSALNIQHDITQKAAKYHNLINKLKFGDKYTEEFFEILAKYNDLLRRVSRITSTKEYSKKQNLHKTADHFEYVLSRMKDENVPLEKIKEFFDNNAIAQFSLTMHPTNPTSTRYTTEYGIEFDRLFSEFLDEEIKDDSIKSFLKSNNKIISEKKSQIEEMSETIIHLDCIYKASVKLRSNLKNTLEKFEDFKKVININRPLIKACIWATGDGDGNENATDQSLYDGIKALKKRITELYISDLESLILDQEHVSHKDLIVERLRQSIYESPDKLIKDLNVLLPNAYIEELIYKVNIFGFHYAKIDIRHNANDIMTTISYIAKKSHLIEKEDYFIESSDIHIITMWLKDRKTLAKFNNFTDFDNSKNSKIAQRIFNRLKLLKDNPEMSNKLIIAETKSEINIIAAMLLLKATGSKIAEKDSCIDIVTLSESVDDLKKLPDLLDSLINNQTYREHLSIRNKLIPMIAKSDTVRRNGRGAEAIQEESIGLIYAKLGKIKEKYPELVNLSIEGFDGGGAALQRGGGKPTETAHNHGRNARNYGAITMGPSHLTFQGHQMSLYFSPSENAEKTLEALVSQNLHSIAQTEVNSKGKRYVTSRNVPAEFDEKRANSNFKKISDVAIISYNQYLGDPDNKSVKGNSAFNKLFENSPWISVIIGNVSSRPSKRDYNLSNSYTKVKDIKGENPKLLDNRAITVERLCAHSGTHLLSYLSLLEGLESISIEELQEMYVCNKSARDFIRKTMIALHMTDFDLAWNMMIGKERPNINKIIDLADEFEKVKYSTDLEQIYQNDIIRLNEITLSWIEQYAMKIAKLCYNIANSKQKYKNNFSKEDFALKTPLREIFPEIAYQLANREKASKFSRYYEAYVTDIINKNPNLELTPIMIDTLKAVYIACDTVNSPEASIAMATTRINYDEIITEKNSNRAQYKNNKENEFCIY